MEFGVCLKGVVQRDEEGEIPDGLEDAALGERMLHDLSLPHDGGLLEHLHGKQLPLVLTVHHANKKHLPIPCNLV